MKYSENVLFALAFACSHVVSKQKPCKLVTHNKSDENWEFMCGEGGHTDKDAVICSVGEILLTDETVADALCIKPGYYAMREKVGDKWISRPLEEDNAEKEE